MKKTLLIASLLALALAACSKKADDTTASAPAPAASVPDATPAPAPAPAPAVPSAATTPAPAASAPAASARRAEKLFESATEIIPGDRGKDDGSWCHPPLPSR